MVCSPASARSPGTTTAAEAATTAAWGLTTVSRRFSFLSSTNFILHGYPAGQQRLPTGQGQPQSLADGRLNVNRYESTHPHRLCDSPRVIAIGLHGQCRGRPLHAARLDADCWTPHLLQPLAEASETAVLLRAQHGQRPLNGTEPSGYLCSTFRMTGWPVQIDANLPRTAITRSLCCTNLSELASDVARHRSIAGVQVRHKSGSLRKPRRCSCRKLDGPPAGQCAE